MYSACLKCIFRQPPPPPPPPRHPFSFPSLQRGSVRNGGSGMEWRHCTRVPINSDAAFSPHGRQPTFSIARIWQKEWERLNSFPEDLAAGSQLDIPSGPVQAGFGGCFLFFFFPSVANGNRLQRPKEVGPFWMCRCFNEAGGMRNQKREKTVFWGLETQHKLGFHCSCLQH